MILAVISSHFSLFYPYHTSYRSADQDLSSDEIGWLVAAADSDIVLSSIVVVRAGIHKGNRINSSFLTGRYARNKK